MKMATVYADSIKKIETGGKPEVTLSASTSDSK